MTTIEQFSPSRHPTFQAESLMTEQRQVANAITDLMNGLMAGKVTMTRSQRLEWLRDLEKLETEFEKNHDTLKMTWPLEARYFNRHYPYTRKVIKETKGLLSDFNPPTLTAKSMQDIWSTPTSLVEDDERYEAPFHEERQSFESKTVRRMLREMRVDSDARKQSENESGDESQPEEGKDHQEIQDTNDEDDQHQTEYDGEQDENESIGKNDQQKKQPRQQTDQHQTESDREDNENESTGETNQRKQKPRQDEQPQKNNNGEKRNKRSNTMESRRSQKRRETRRNNRRDPSSPSSSSSSSSGEERETETE